MLSCALMFTWLSSYHTLLDGGSLSHWVTSASKKAESFLLEALAAKSPLALQYVWIMCSTARNAREVTANMQPLVKERKRMVGQYLGF